VKPIYLKNIPPELACLTRWVVWRGDKVPRTPGTGRAASTTEPATWRSLGQALHCVRCGQAEGIGFVFTATPFAGIDLDGCLHEDGLTPQAARIVAELSSYTEISPSGTGLHVIVRGRLPPGARRRGEVEMYDTDRYFTVTGQVWGGLRTIERRQVELARLHARLLARPEPSDRQRLLPSPPRSDQDLLDRAASARNGGKFARLWAGDCSGYDSQSEDDLALCNLLAFWSGGDAARVDRLFRPKWDERHHANGETYGQGTIQRALSEGGAGYGASEEA
jgi:putative DNA primase/helicase